MERIPLYTDLENLMNIFSQERTSNLFLGMKQFLSKESEVIICQDEEQLETNPLFPHLAKEFTDGDFTWKHFDATRESFLIPPFKTNLQVQFSNKSSIYFSNDNSRISIAVEKNGILMAGIGDEFDVYNKLNFSKDFFRANRILTIGTDFTNYKSFENYILPFNEIIINEPYLFVPERRDYNIEQYLECNFKSLFDVVFKKIKNKVNIIICTFVNEQDQISSPWYDNSNRTFSPLYDYVKNYLVSLLGGASKFNLWLIVSPMARQARHDRYILTNYQYIESGAGLTYFDDRGNFINRGEAVHLYSIMHDDARKNLIPSIISKIQNNVINSILTTSPERIISNIQEKSNFLNFS